MLLRSGGRELIDVEVGRVSRGAEQGVGKMRAGQDLNLRPTD